MEFVITFFRDILDGPIYIIVAIICGILFCACIGYLAEKSQKKRKLKEQYVEIKQQPTSSQNTPAVQTTTTEQVKPQVVSVTVAPTKPQPIPVQPMNQNPVPIPTNPNMNVQPAPTMKPVAVNQAGVPAPKNQGQPLQQSQAVIPNVQNSVK